MVSDGKVSLSSVPFWRRIERISPSRTTIYAYDGDNVIEEFNSAGTATARYAQGLGIDEPLARAALTTPLGKYFYQADGLGSITSLSDLTGALANTYVYDSFGNVYRTTGTVTNPYRFTAREFDSETGLYYYRARYYDPTVGRFVSEDPERFIESVNFYPYSDNSPTNFVDPFGLEPQGCADCKGRPKQGAQFGKMCCANEAPMSGSGPSPYPPSYTYLGVSATDMFHNGGNGEWGNIVRGCLVCMYRHGVDPSTAHHFCYVNGWKRTTNWQTAKGVGAAVSQAYANFSASYWQSGAGGLPGVPAGPPGW